MPNSVPGDDQENDFKRWYVWIELLVLDRRLYLNVSSRMLKFGTRKDRENGFV